jgi:Arc/MetJ-type ribon-helix-helix transcriptional regulator
LDGLEVLVNLGFFPSRSEAVRQALKEFLTREPELTEGLQLETFKTLKENQLQALVR